MLVRPLLHVVHGTSKIYACALLDPWQRIDTTRWKDVANTDEETFTEWNYNTTHNTHIIRWAKSTRQRNCSQTNKFFQLQLTLCHTTHRLRVYRMQNLARKHNHDLHICSARMLLSLAGLMREITQHTGNRIHLSLEIVCGMSQLRLAFGWCTTKIPSVYPPHECPYYELIQANQLPMLLVHLWPLLKPKSHSHEHLIERQNDCVRQSSSVYCALLCVCVLAWFHRETAHFFRFYYTFWPQHMRFMQYISVCVCVSENRMASAACKTHWPLE